GLLRDPPRMDQQTRKVIDQEEEVGALTAGLARMGDEWPHQHVPDPELVGPVGFEAAIDPGCAGEDRPLEAAALQMLADGALRDPHAVACLEDGADLGRRASRNLLA